MAREPTSHGTPEEVIAAWGAANPDLALRGDEGASAGQRWSVMLRGERKRTIPVVLQLGEHTLDVQSFFMRAPDEHADELYGYLLGRNMRTYVLRFALHPDGDVLIVGVIPRSAVTPDVLDRVMGQLLVAADDAFDTALRLGFTSYIEREQQWRMRNGLPRNPIT